MNDAPNLTTDYKSTVFLPTTSFPMRGDLPKREPDLLARWDRIGLRQRTKAQMAGRPTFVLHDGPIYSNGNLHIGHALNRILKDVIMRAHRMAGEDADYIPGWDTHGLPIEWKVEEEYRKTGRDKDAVPVLDFRDECRRYSAHWLAVQTAEFQRLGVTGDWAGRYATMDYPSEAAIAGEICKFLLNGALYRGLRPVMWSPVERTALAEAEIEYHDRTSDTVFVRFPVLPNGGLGDGPLAGASVVIWTTTPWTMPGNRALAYGPEIDYALMHVDSVTEGSLARPGERLLIALALLPQVCGQVGIATHHVVHVYKGAELAGLTAAHPLRGQGYDHDAPLLPAEYVTTEQGTGLVHIAPSHGEEDFLLSREHGIEVPEAVGPDGTYAPWVPIFAGLHVFKAAAPVGAALEAAGGLLGRGTLTHSYPHSWRSKAPVIYRATPQWFIRMDGPEHLREHALQEIAKTAFIPEAGRTRLASMVAGRPDWCISRQRAWGVPIPVFVDRRTGEPLRDPAVVARIVDIFTAEGADAWYNSPPSRFLGNDRDPDGYEQVMDIVDVWFESGSTHGFALQDRGLPWPADLYLEGSDQHRGWFQHSLLEAVGTRGRAPFKAVLTHGFVLDEAGRKMSKSLGNVTAPQEVTDKMGADILRLWVVNSDVSEDLRIGPEILKQQAELYRRLRNTLRWLLGSLDGFAEAERLPDADMPELDRWVLHRLSVLDARIRGALASHDWTGVYPDLHAFCSSDLSAFYFDVRKDVLYCDAPDSPRRRAVRTVLDHLHRCLVAWLAPVLCFTAEEAWLARYPSEDGSVHLQAFPDLPASWHDPALDARWAAIRNARGGITTALEAARLNKLIGASLQAAITVPPALLDLLDADAWAEVAIVSSASPGDALKIDRAPGEKCARCWRVLPEVGSQPSHPALCVRCADVVEGLSCQAAAE
jgi:isoleucyl-tRNA synthetase